MIEWIALFLSAIAIFFSFMWRSAPNSLLVRQVAELTHELRHLAQDMELLETKFTSLAGRVNQTARKTKTSTEDAEDLTPEQRKFLESTVEYQAMQKYKNEEH